MPGFDRTGPMGYGPMTGGGRGPCAGGRAGQGGAMRTGRRQGGGFGWRHQFNATGLTGWQRAGRAAQEPTRAAEAFESQDDPFARIEAGLAGVIERLERLEAARHN